MDLQLQGKRIRVTGSNTAIGERIADVMVREGATVLCSREYPFSLDGFSSREHQYPPRRR
jgi:hypothetical protein